MMLAAASRRRAKAAMPTVRFGVFWRRRIKNDRTHKFNENIQRFSGRERSEPCGGKR